MKALSIRQPWAWLIVTGRKDIENRNWATEFRGRFLVHAAQTFDVEGYKRVRRQLGSALPARDAFELGGIVGEAEIVKCVSTHPSPWFTGPWGFVLRNARPLPFRALRGRLGFFDVAEPDERGRVESEPSPGSTHKPSEELIGRVVRYDAPHQAMDVALIAALSRGDFIRVRDHATDRIVLEQAVARLRVEGRDVPTTTCRDTARIEVAQAVKRDDRVFRLMSTDLPHPGPEPPPLPPPGPTPPPEPAPTLPDSPAPDDEPDLPDLDDAPDDNVPDDDVPDDDLPDDDNGEVPNDDDTPDDDGETPDDGGDETTDDESDVPDDDDDAPDDDDDDDPTAGAGDGGPTSAPWPTRPRPKRGGPGG